MIDHILNGRKFMQCCQPWTSRWRYQPQAHFPTSSFSWQYNWNQALVKELNIPSWGAKDLYFATQYSQSFFGKFSLCLWKQWWTYWRSPDYNVVSMSSHLFLPCSLEQSFGRSTQNGMYSSYNSARNITIQTFCFLDWLTIKCLILIFCVIDFSSSRILRNSLNAYRRQQQWYFHCCGALYGAVKFLVISNCSTVQPVVVVEITLFYRERAARMYSTLPLT